MYIFKHVNLQQFVTLSKWSRFLQNKSAWFLFAFIIQFENFSTTAPARLQCLQEVHKPYLALFETVKNKQIFKEVCTSAFQARTTHLHSNPPK